MSTNNLQEPGSHEIEPDAETISAEATEKLQELWRTYGILRSRFEIHLQMINVVPLGPVRIDDSAPKTIGEGGRKLLDDVRKAKLPKTLLELLLNGVEAQIKMQMTSLHSLAIMEPLTIRDELRTILEEADNN